MKVQSHSNEIRPLISEGYLKVYDALSRRLSPEEMIFAKWEAGFGDVLQWTLDPEYQWRNFSQADAYDRQNITNEFHRLCNSGVAKLGDNEKLKRAVYSVPSEANVYYTITPDGKYRIMLTAWGYAFPNKAPLTPIEWNKTPDAQDVTLRFVDNGALVDNLQFDIIRPGGHKLHKTSDNNGECHLGPITPPSTINIDIPARNIVQSIKVVAGQAFYTVDITTIVQQQKPDEHQEDVIEEVEEEVLILNDGSPIFNLHIFHGNDGSPLASTQVVLSTSSFRTVKTTDENGFINIDSSEIPLGTEISIEPVNNDPNGTAYPPATMLFSADETQYEIAYNDKKRSLLWLELILWLLAAAAAFCTLYFSIGY